MLPQVRLTSNLCKTQKCARMLTMHSAKNSKATYRPLSDLGAKLAVALFIFLIGSTSFAQSPVGGEPLFDAAKSGDVEVVRRHLNRGASPNERDWANAPLILRAACHGRIEVIRLLVERGADVNARQGGDWTAIFCAARYDELATVEFLIESGADLSLRDEDGDSIADTARQGEAWRVVRLLEGDAARVTTPEPSELSCDELSRYIASKNTEAFSAAMEQGSDSEEKAMETMRLFVEMGRFAARGLIKNCPGNEYGTAAVIDLDFLSAQSCKDLRLAHAFGVLDASADQIAFEHAIGDGDSEKEGPKFASLSTSAHFLGAIEEVMSEHRCRLASSAEIQLLLEVLSGSDSIENFDIEQEWDAIDQGDAAAEQPASSAAEKTASQCARVGFYVEDGHLLTETGLKPKIADLVRVRLRTAGLYEPMTESSRGISRHLAVRVSLPSFQNNSTASLFHFSTEVTFYQQPAGAIRAPVEAVWIGGDSGLGPTSEIANDVLKHVDRFVGEYKAANPGCSGS